MLRLGFILILLLQSLSYPYNNFKNAPVDDISIIKKSFNKSYHTYQLNVTYPELRDWNNEKHIALNLAVQGYMFEAITRFQDKVDTFINKNSFSYFNFDYTVCSNFEQAMSLKFTKRSYHPGMEKAMEYYRTLNFDKNSGRIIHLEDLFLFEVDYQKELLKIINKKYRNCKLPSNTQLHAFCLSEPGLIIVLDEHLLPDSFCANQIEIEWQVLREIINPDSIGYLLMNKV